MEAYPLFNFVTLYQKCAYTPYAIFIVSTEEASEEFFDFAVADFPDCAAFEAYVQMALSKSIIDLNVDVEYGEKLLTLATCTNEMDKGRLVVACRAIREDEIRK